MRKSFYVEKNMEIRMKFCGSSVTSCHVMLHQTCKFTLYFCNLNLNPHISLSYPPNKDSLKLIYLTCIWADLEVQSALYR